MIYCLLAGLPVAELAGDERRHTKQRRPDKPPGRFLPEAETDADGFSMTELALRLDLDDALNEPMPTTAPFFEEPVPTATRETEREPGPWWSTRLGPIIPEPMVFDLIRPLHTAKGELELNVLGLINSRRVDWAPEIEYAIADGFAVEFEVPMENGSLEAYKFATQYTFGTALNNQFIHGVQGILEYERYRRHWTPTLLYMAGYRFDDTWSVFTMFGARTRIGGRAVGARTDLLTNLNLFANITQELVAGIETNFSFPAGSGQSDILIMPQLHYDLSEHITIQLGVGPRFSGHHTTLEAGFRFILEWD